MNQEEINKRNEAIALFMGKVANPVDKGATWSVGFFYGDENGKIIGADNWKPLQYYSSWDWLMPVVEKIEATTGDHNKYRFTMGIESNGTTYCFINEGAAVRVSWGESKSKIESVFLAVSDFCLKQHRKTI